MSDRNLNRRLDITTEEPEYTEQEAREFRLAAREAARVGSVTQVRNLDGTVIAEIVPAGAILRDPPAVTGACLPTRAELLTGALQENREVVAAEIRRCLSNIRAEVRRCEEMMAHYNSVFDLRLTQATSDGPATTEGTPA